MSLETLSRTHKLFYKDSCLFDFSSQIEWVGRWSDRPAIVLKETAFYGEAGGQAGDRGWIRMGENELQVLDVQIEDGVYVHCVEGDLEGFAKGQMVNGHVDPGFRWDFMRQHTGQHILSGAFFKEFGLKTISSRLGSQTSTIDIDLENPDWLTMETVERVVNKLIMENRPISILFPSDRELEKMTLRRTPKVKENIRVIAIEGFDMTPCGGTHCRWTGEVGYVKILGQERYKGMTRVTFAAGERAIGAIQERERSIRQVVDETECQVSELSHLINGLRDSLRDTRQSLGVARKLYLQYLSEHMLASRANEGGHPIWIAERDHLDAAERRVLAGLLTAKTEEVVLIVSKEEQTGKRMLVLTSRDTHPVDLGKWFRSCCAGLGAKGGGRPHHVEGFFPPESDWPMICEELNKSAENGFK